MYTPTIGLEVHAELKTNSKMFCGCKNQPHETTPNTNICPICTGQPGSLPVPNSQAIKKVLMFGRAINGQLANFSEFDRKNYFYPDIPKAYQISQYAYPFVVGGELAGITLTRVHLEEDTARSQHDKGEYSLVDFNRAGVPLLELVTEPVIHSSIQASNFAKELQLLFRTLDISDANMEKGEMRIEANISVSANKTLGTKVEVKNLNSFKSVEQAITYEVARQIQILEKGDTVEPETRGWDEQKQTTFTQRKKETAKDYRYFPDPDITKYRLDEIEEFNISRLNDSLPILPDQKRVTYAKLGLAKDSIEQIINNNWLDNYFNQVINLPNFEPNYTVLLVNYLLTDLLPIIETQVDQSVIIAPTELYQIVIYASARQITSRVAKDMIIEFALTPSIDIKAVLQTRKLFNDLSVAELDQLIQVVVDENPQVVIEYKNGKLSVLQYLLGQIMRISKGKADPKLAISALKKKLG